MSNDRDGKISRRSFSAASGALVLGAGLGSVLTARPAQGAEETKVLVHVYKREGKGRRLLSTFEMSDELADSIDASGDAAIRVHVDEDGTEKRTLGEAPLAEAPKVREALRKRKARRTKLPNK